jgi:hypothetical protein
VETNKSDNSVRRDPSEKEAVVGTYLQKNNSQCDKTCNSQGKRRRGRPKITWQQSVESEMREMSLSFGWLE